MDTTLLLSSSLSSRSHATTEQSSTFASSVVPHLSFRHRRRSRHRRRQHHHQPPPAPTLTTSTTTPPHLPRPASPTSPRPWHRIRTRMSVMERAPHPVQLDDRPRREFSASSTASPIPTAVKQAPVISESPADPAKARRMLTNTSALKKRPVRRLAPPTRSVFLDKSCASVTEFLRPALIPVGYSPDSIDPSFKSHSHLLRKLTLDDFDLNRYLFAYKPLARVNAVLTTALLAVTDVDHRTCPMTPALRSAVMYVAGNAYRSLYVMTFSAQLKSTARSRPATEGVLPGMVLEGVGLSDVEVSALDFAQELSSSQAVVTEMTRRKVQHLTADPDGKLERLVTATASYAAFLSSLTNSIDIELTHASIQYATDNLYGLPWKCSGSPVNVDFVNDDIGDFGPGNGASGLGSKYRPKRERLSLTRTYDRHSRDRTGGRGRPRGLRLVSQFFASTLMGVKSSTDVVRVTEMWMKESDIPGGDQLFDMNDEIHSLFGFHPFYFSTAAMDCESTRRAFLYGVKELLFSEVEIPRRLKFIICYVLSSGKERRRIMEAEMSRSFEKQGVHSGHSINSVYAHRTYDSLSIMSAQAAFLACKYGAKPAELVAASDVSRVRSAMERYSPDGNTNLTNHSIGFPLSVKDCAAVLIAHSLVRETPYISNEDLTAFGKCFSYPGNLEGEPVSESSRIALMEIIGAASMWHALERYATGTLGFDIDCTSNMVFGLSRAEPTISEFCRGPEGKKIGLSLGCNELRNVTRATSDSCASRTSSMRPSVQSTKRTYKKRTSSALGSNPRVGRLFSGTGPAAAQENHSKWTTAAT